MQNTLPIAPLSLPFAAKLAMPGSKSMANRAIIAACLADGKTIITNATACDDVALMVKNLQLMGFHLRWIDEVKGELEIIGGIPAPRSSDDFVELFCENAGTTVRFLTSLACLVPGRWMIAGNEHMSKRPIGNLIQTLQAMGADIEDNSGYLPLRVRGGKWKGGQAQLDASKSSQFLSSLLLVAPRLEKGLSITLTSTLASPSYVELTEQVMNTFGVQIDRDADIEKSNTFFVRNQNYVSPETISIEGDWSGAGAFLVLCAITGSSIDYTNLNFVSSQGDRFLVDGIKALSAPGDYTVDCTDLPDQVMNLALFCAFRSGTVTITGAKNLRIKECDRLAVTQSELSKVGIDIVEHDDGLIIKGNLALLASIGQSNKTHVLDPHDDHRMAMLFGVLGSLMPGISVKNSTCVSKSYPQFFDDLASLHQHSKPIVIIGMRASGKSNLGRRLSSSLRMPFVDTDKIIEKKAGTSVSEFVAQNGWPMFRDLEQSVIAESLKSGHILTLGGGAVESEATRKLIKERAIIIWMQTTAKGTFERLQIAKRPQLTDLPLDQEVAQLHAKRDPLYAQLTTIALPDTVPFGQQVAWLTARLTVMTRYFNVHTRQYDFSSIASVAKPSFKSRPIRHPARPPNPKS
ncbi:MAG: 3-phosphoshikimate 1-carboxyvinyltransferase [Candidatus Peribacteraceae bacterium]|nr:3-phosphoshikimate 1-carboxyvinyltransferase [Candidatus Peribacteraceae bacterium]